MGVVQTYLVTCLAGPHWTVVWTDERRQRLVSYSGQRLHLLNYWLSQRPARDQLRHVYWSDRQSPPLYPWPSLAQPRGNTAHRWLPLLYRRSGDMLSECTARNMETGDDLFALTVVRR